MSKKRIGALIIGQSPRSDLVTPLEQLLPDFEIIQYGALDGIAGDNLPGITDAVYPLVTRMHNGETVRVEESFVAPKLQQALNRLEAKGTAATILLCAGTFAELNGTRPLFKPFEIGFSILRALNLNSIGLIAPVVEQETPIYQRWKSVGFQPIVWTADLGKQDTAFYKQIKTHIHQFGLQCIVLDYVGHSIDHVKQIQTRIDIPIFDLGYLAMVTLASSVSFRQ